MGVAALPGQLRFYRVLKDYSWCESRGSLHSVCSFLAWGDKEKENSKA